MTRRKFKIQKFFRGGSTVYYAMMPYNKQMKHGYWKYQLQDWGEGTDGGFNYGYQIKVTQIKNSPRKNTRHRELSFNLDYLQKVNIGDNTTEGDK